MAFKFSKTSNTNLNKLPKSIQSILIDALSKSSYDFGITASEGNSITLKTYPNNNAAFKSVKETISKAANIFGYSITTTGKNITFQIKSEQNVPRTDPSGVLVDAQKKSDDLKKYLKYGGYILGGGLGLYLLYKIVFKD